MKIRAYLQAFFVLILLGAGDANLWDLLEKFRDLSEFQHLCSLHAVAQAYLKDGESRITVFAPTDDVFNHNPHLKNMSRKELLGHFVDVQVLELGMDQKWEQQTLIRQSVQSGTVFISQFESGPNNFSYFINNARICNWLLATQEQLLYKICSPMGERAFPGAALDLVRTPDTTVFQDRGYSNRNLIQLRDNLERQPAVSLIIFGSSAHNGFHTFFLPNDEAFGRVSNKSRINREVLLAHVTGVNRVLFTEAWLDHGIFYQPSVNFQSNYVEDNLKLKLSIRNITNEKTGSWQMYAVSKVSEPYSSFKRGAVWAKIVKPNIPVSNGVVHIIDSILGIVPNTIDQLLNEDPECQSLMYYINVVGSMIRSYLSATGGTVTFFAPVDTAFDRIPESVEKRLLRDRVWLEKILKLHILPGTELTSDQINNDTIGNTADNREKLYFSKGANNMSYFVQGSGLQASILREDIAATNGIIHYIDRVLGVPYQTLFEVLRNDSNLQYTCKGLRETNLRFTLDPWEVIRPEQNFTFFIPTNEAWLKMPSALKTQLMDGQHWKKLDFVTFSSHFWPRFVNWV